MGKVSQDLPTHCGLVARGLANATGHLLTDPGHVLDHLLARHDAESDGRSPRGAHPTPPRLADAVICSEMKDKPGQPEETRAAVELLDEQPAARFSTAR